MTAAELGLVVAGKRSIADGVVELVLRHPDDAPLPDWAPGAHLDLVVGGLVRQYSLCGGDRFAYRLAVLRENPGRGGSRYVHDVLAVGDEVRIRGPRNHFPLVPAARYLFIAGGIGITPILPMIAAAGRPWRLVYGGRTRSSMAFAAELERDYPGRIEIRPQDEYGLLDLPALLATPDADTAIYCCGPEPLLRAAEKHCAAWPSEALHVERFTPQADDGPGETFEVELARSGLVVPVPAERSILQAIEDAGMAVEFSCREGTCGTCETTVLAGRPDHRDSVLSAAERDVGDTLMICVSRSHSPRLVLDL